MKFFIDENLSPIMRSPLESIFRKHHFRTADMESLRGVEDTTLFGDLHDRSFDAIITHDVAQLAKYEERSGLREAGLHWIGVGKLEDVSGLEIITVETSVVLAGLPHVLNDWRSEPHIYGLVAPGHYGALAPWVERI